MCRARKPTKNSMDLKLSLLHKSNCPAVIQGLIVWNISPMLLTVCPLNPFLVLLYPSLDSGQLTSTAYSTQSSAFLVVGQCCGWKCEDGRRRRPGYFFIILSPLGGILTITYDQAPAGSPSLLQHQQNFQPREGHGSFKSGHTLGLPCGLVVKTPFPLQGV